MKSKILNVYKLKYQSLDSVCIVLSADKYPMDEIDYLEGYYYKCAISYKGTGCQIAYFTQEDLEESTLILNVNEVIKNATKKDEKETDNSRQNEIKTK